MLFLALLTGIALGAVAGAAAAWSAARNRSDGMLSGMRDRAANAEISAQDAMASVRRELAVAETVKAERDQRIATLETERESARAEATALRSELASQREACARLETQIDDERRSTAEKLAVVVEAESSFREAFSSLSSEALQKNNQSFLDLAKESLGGFQQQATGDLEKRQQAIDELVTPIRSTLEKFGERVHDIEKARVDAYATLQQQVKSMGETQRALHGETANLVRALRAPNVRGRWGEIQLRRVVEMAGMLERCDFSEQRTLMGDDGRMRPDLVVHLAGGRSIVVDAKTPLDAYISSIEASDDAERAKHLKQHVRQVRDHIAKLGQKQYWAQMDQTPDVVIMFVPGDPILQAAIEQDAALFEYAMQQRVMLATPWNLIGLLQAVAYGWRQEAIAQNAAQISELGRLLYDRLCKMQDHFDKLRRSLESTVEAYNATAASLETRVLVGARRFGELGVTAAQELPEATTIDRAPRPLTGLMIDSPSDEIRTEAPPEFLVRG